MRTEEPMRLAGPASSAKCRIWRDTSENSRTLFAITGCVRARSRPCENTNSVQSMFIHCRSEGISIFAVALVNCDENNIPRRCNGESYILSAWTGFRFLRFPACYFPRGLPLSFSLSFPPWFSTLGAALDVCYRAWLSSNWKFTLGARREASGCIFFLLLFFSCVCASVLRYTVHSGLSKYPVCICINFT